MKKKKFLQYSLPLFLYCFIGYELVIIILARISIDLLNKQKYDLEKIIYAYNLIKKKVVNILFLFLFLRYIYEDYSCIYVIKLYEYVFIFIFK